MRSPRRRAFGWGLLSRRALSAGLWSTALAAATPTVAAPLDPQATPALAATATASAPAAAPTTASPASEQRLPWILYGDLGAGYLGGARVVTGGLGPGLGLRRELVGPLSAHVDVATRVFLPASLEVDLGLVASARVGRWRPGLGVELAGVAGGAVRRFSSAYPDPPHLPLFGVRGLLRPLCFDAGRLQLSGLEVGLGTGVGAAAPALSLGIGFFQVGWRL